MQCRVFVDLPPWQSFQTFSNSLRYMYTDSFRLLGSTLTSLVGIGYAEKGKYHNSMR